MDNLGRELCKYLIENVDLIIATKRGRWVDYELNHENFQEINQKLNQYMGEL